MGFALAVTLVWPATAMAQEPPGEYLLQMARVDFLVRKRQFPQAAEELGRIPKAQQEDPLFQQYVEKVLAALYGPEAGGEGEALSPEQQDFIRAKLGVVRHRRDADRRSDQNGDGKGWQVNQHLEADVEGKDGIRARFLMNLDGFKDGHNDVRYRTLLADFYDEPSHFAIGDSATYTSPYFMRASRMRGLDLLLRGERNEFQALLGAYPYWNEDRDEYFYPRMVWGIRDKVEVMEDRIAFGANLIQTRDDEKIRTLDGANPQARTDPVFQVRDNIVFSLDQEVKFIPDILYLKAAQAYSNTDDNLIEDRFGENAHLKDTSFRLESLFIQPWVRWTSYTERTGPDFRLLTDLPQGAVNSPKDIRADTLRTEHFFDFPEVGPFDLDMEGSWVRNNLDDDNNVEQTRQRWLTTLLGIRVPDGWPRPRFRGTLIDTVSVPGTTTRPAQTRELDLRGELSHTFGGMHWTGTGDYGLEVPSADKEAFDEEESWGFGARMGTTLLNRLHVSPHYRYEFFDQIYDEDRVRGNKHEAGISNSLPLWSTSSLGLSYTYLHGKVPDVGSTKLVHASGHMADLSFTWPYTHHSWNKRHRFTAFPSVSLHLSDLSNDLENRPVLATRLKMAYDVMKQWRMELGGEYRYDHEQDVDEIRTQESRMWLLWTSDWK